MPLPPLNVTPPLNGTRRRAIAATATATTLLLSGCGAEVATEDEETAKTTVHRCGEPVEYTTPERAVAYEGGSADKLFSLGLTEHVHGYVMPPANPPVSEGPWASEYAKVKKLSDDLLNRELVVDAKADFVVAGWNSGFSDQRGITPEILDKLKIQSFVHSESCYNYPNFPEEKKPFEALYSDLARLGKIFNVEEKSKQVVAGLKKREKAVVSKAPEGKRVPVFLYDSGTDRPFTAGNQVPPQEIIAKAGGRNVFSGLDERWTQVSWESVTKANPEVVIILDYGDKPAKEKIEFLKKSPQTKNLPAVRKDNFFVLDYNEGISGPRNIDGLEKFGTYLRNVEN